MKKILIVGVFVFAIALTANVAFATTCPGGQCGGPQICPCPDQSNTAHDITLSVSSGAYTGGNSITMAGVNGTGIWTGNAVSSARGVNAVNSNLAVGSSRGDNAQVNKANDITAGVSSAADTGLNGISKAHTSGAGIITGNSTSRVSGINLVNTNVRIGGESRR